jgi:hypothetical protein
MNPETLAALKGSIEKWRKIVEEAGEDEGASNCPLCQLLWPRNHGSCLGCPVQAASGRYYCKGTPYEEWSERDFVSAVEEDGSMKLACAELAFLRSLLPKEEA